MTGRRDRAPVALALALALTASGPPAPAQDAPAAEGQMYGADQFFHLVWEPVEYGGQLSIGGYVTNNYGLEATRVSLIVESLDRNGRIIAKTIGYVNYPIPPGSRGFFEIFLPSRAARYRVSILSWDWRRDPSGS
jgi:hypothetical protein